MVYMKHGASMLLQVLALTLTITLANAIEPEETHNSESTLVGNVVDKGILFKDTEMVTLMEEDFEGAFPPAGWEVWQAAPAWWDAWSCFNSSSGGSRSAGCAADGPEGISCGEEYPDDMHTILIYGPFSLENAVSAELVFDYEINVEERWDNFWWKAGLDDNGPFYGYSHYETNGTPHWVGTRHFDLTIVPTLGNLCGENQVWIVFEFVSDDCISGGEGVSIDEVFIGVDTPAQTSSWTQVKTVY